MLTHVVFLLAGLVLVIKGGELFVAASIRAAEFLRMPRVVIGSTLVSLATTTPELVVSIVAGLKGEAGLAVGNAVGSVVCNLCVIVGVTAMLKHVDVSVRALRVPLMVMIGAGVILFLMTLDLRLSRWQGVLLLTGGLAYFACDFLHHLRDRVPADVAEATAIEEERGASGWAWFQTGGGTAVQFVAGALVVVLGSKLLVDGAVGVAQGLGIPSMVIGLTVVAIGTSLPELVTAVTSSRRSVSDLAVGNVLGANIANLTLIVGTAAAFGGISLTRETQLFDLPAMLVIMGLLVFVMSTGQRITRREGVMLILTYGLYLALVLGLAAWHARPDGPS